MTDNNQNVQSVAQPTPQPAQPAQPQAPTPPPPANPEELKNIEEKLTTAADKTKQEILNDPTVAQTFATTTELQNEVVDIEKDLLNEIIVRLDQNKMSREEAQNLAKEFLSYLPIQDQHDLLEKLKKLSKSNTAAQSIYLKYAKEEEESETNKKLELMTQHLHAGNIEHALTVAKGGTPNV